MKAKTLMDKSWHNYNIAQMLFQSKLADDEDYLNYIAYHLQQSVELAIKHLLECNGYVYPKTHSINQLIQCCEQIGKREEYIPSYIDGIVICLQIGSQ